MLCARILLRRCSTTTKSNGVQERLYDSHVLTTEFQKMVLAVGSSMMALNDPWRADMVAVSGEVTGKNALSFMHNRMKTSREGRLILKNRPEINTKTIDFEHLQTLPQNTLGWTYVNFCQKHNITPDSRDAVQFVDDEDLAYVMKRYRETHDLVHAVLDMPTNMVGEALVKWVEALQTGLPMCIGGAVLGPSRFSRHTQFVRFRKLRPWAIEVGKNSKFLLNVYYEDRWEQDIDELRQELRIPQLPS